MRPLHTCNCYFGYCWGVHVFSCWPVAVQHHKPRQACQHFQSSHTTHTHTHCITLFPPSMPSFISSHFLSLLICPSLVPVTFLSLHRQSIHRFTLQRRMKRLMQDKQRECFKSIWRTKSVIISLFFLPSFLYG